MAEREPTRLVRLAALMKRHNGLLPWTLLCTETSLQSYRAERRSSEPWKILAGIFVRDDIRMAWRNRHDTRGWV